MILKLPAVLERTALSKSALYGLIRRGAFPPGLKLTTKAVGWHEHDVAQWFAAREAERHEEGPRPLPQGRPRTRGPAQSQPLDSLRDDFAAKAMQAMTGCWYLSGGPLASHLGFEHIADDAYAMAAAMLKARQS